MRVAHHVVHHAYVALDRFERCEGGSQRVTIDQSVPSPAAGKAARFVQLDMRAAPCSMSPHVETRVDQDAVDPGSLCGLASEVAASREGAHIGLLHHVFRLIAVDESGRNGSQLAVRLHVGVSERSGADGRFAVTVARHVIQ